MINSDDTSLSIFSGSCGNLIGIDYNDDINFLEDGNDHNNNYLS